MTTQAVPVFSRWRAGLVQDLDGDVLEIGVGSGANLRYYRRARQVWAIEPDAEQAEKATLVARQAGLKAIVKVGAAEELPFPAAHFDHVVSSLVFCSVSDPRLALSEIRRVLKPGGTLHMVEHVRPQSTWLATLFGAVTPYWSKIAHNCHLDRATVDLLRAEGWSVVIHKRIAVFVRLSAQHP